MESCRLAVLAAAVARVLAVGASDVDWSAYEGANYSLAAEDEVVVTESQMAAFNRIASLTFADASGRLVFDGCATAPNVDIVGKGTVEKRGDDIWTLSRQLTNFTGPYVLSGGFVSLLAQSTLGNFESEGGRIVVTNGATLCVSNEYVYFKSRKLEIAGNGYNGCGVLNMTSGDKAAGMFRYGFKLLDDAYVNFSGAPYVKGTVELNGHVLRKGGTGHLMLHGGTLTGEEGSCVVLEPGAPGKQTGWTMREKSSISDSPEVRPLYLNDNSDLRFWNNPDPFYGSIYASGTVRILRYNQGSTGYVYETDDYNHIYGPIVLSNAATSLTFYHNGGRKTDGPDFTNMLHVTGRISGPGSVAVSGNGRTYLNCPTNAWEGTTRYSYAGKYSRLCLAAPGSVPDFSKLTIDGTGLCLGLKSGLWTWDAAAALFNDATFASGDLGVGIDFFGCPDEQTEVTLGAVNPPAMTNGKQYLFVNAPGKTLTITGGTDRVELPRLFVGGGTLRFAGPQTKVELNEKTIVGSYDADEWATLRIEDGADVHVPSRELVNPVALGQYSASQAVKDPWARLVVSNATFRTEQWTIGYGKSQTNAFTMGSSSTKSLVEAWDGALISNKFVMSASSSAISAVHQYGGKIVPFGDGTGNAGGAATMVGYYFGHGYWRTSAGEVEPAGAFVISQNGSTGLYEQYGGSFVSGAAAGAPTKVGSVYLASAGQSAWAGMYVGGGSLTSESIWLATGGNKAQAIMTVAGEGTVVSTKTVTGPYYKATGIVTVKDGGVLEMERLYGRYSNANYEKNGWYEFTVNFDGGVVRGVRTQMTLFGLTGADNNACPTRMTVWNGGAEIDVGEAKVCTVMNPLLPPEGGGVESISWSTDTYAVAPPFVRIEGDGTGASAMCNYDPKTGFVTNVTVLSRGCDYTWAKAVIFHGSANAASTNAVVDCVVTSNESHRQGGFTKSGAGELQLMSTNNWQGVTVIAGGTLTASVEGAIPPASTVSVRPGGRLRLTAGVPYPTSISFDPPADEELLACEILTTDDVRATEPTISVPAGWKLIAGNRSWQVRQLHGLMLLLR